MYEEHIIIKIVNTGRSVEEELQLIPTTMDRMIYFFVILFSVTGFISLVTQDLGGWQMITS